MSEVELMQDRMHKKDYDMLVMGANHLGAVRRLGDWYHYSGRTRTWYRVTKRDVLLLGRALAYSDTYAHNRAYAYNRWFSDTNGVELTLEESKRLRLC